MWPPVGTVQKAVLLCEQQQITIPYSVTTLVSGTTTAMDNAQDTSGGLVEAGEAFGWINTYKCAGGDSSSYSDAGAVAGIGQDAGAVTLTGKVVITQYGNFITAVVDYTEKGKAEC